MKRTADTGTARRTTPTTAKERERRRPTVRQDENTRPPPFRYEGFVLRLMDDVEDHRELVREMLAELREVGRADPRVLNKAERVLEITLKTTAKQRAIFKEATRTGSFGNALPVDVENLIDDVNSLITTNIITAHALRSWARGIAFDAEDERLFTALADSLEIGE